LSASVLEKSEFNRIYKRERERELPLKGFELEADLPINRKLKPKV
jgi:hypothetical protein